MNRYLKPEANFMMIAGEKRKYGWFSIDLLEAEKNGRYRKSDKILDLWVILILWLKLNIKLNYLLSTKNV